MAKRVDQEILLELRFHLPIWSSHPLQQWWWRKNFLNLIYITQANLSKITLYGLNKPHQTEKFVQSRTNYITDTQIITTGGGFNMVLEFRDRMGGTICNTHLAGSVSLNKLIKTQKLLNTWRKINPEKIDFTYHRIPSNIHSRFDRTYASQSINIINSTILPFQHSYQRPCLQKLSYEREPVVQGTGN